MVQQIRVLDALVENPDLVPVSDAGWITIACISSLGSLPPLLGSVGSGTHV